MRQLTNWLKAYMDYTRNQESPDLFHLWTAISCISVALGRKVWLERGAFRIYPNHYVFLVAATAQCRKSTAAHIGKKLIDKAKIAEVSAEKLTDAYLWRQLHEIASQSGSSVMFSFADELKNFLRPDDARSGVITTLTTLYNCPDYIKSGTKTAGVDSLTDVCLNLLAATTPKDFSTIIPSGSTESGFVPRVHIVHQEVPRPRISEPTLVEELEPKLIGDLVEIAKLRGEIRLIGEARGWYNNWYEEEFNPPRNEILDGWYGRKHDYVLKLGMVLSVAEKEDLILKEERYLVKALEYLDQLEVFMLSMYDGVESTPSLRYSDSVLQQVRSAKEISYSALLRMQGRRLDTNGLQEVCRFLEVSEQIKRISSEDGRGIRYRIKRKGGG